MVSMFKHSIWNKVPNDLINPSLAVSMNTFKHSLCYFHSSLLYQFSFKKNFGGRFMTTYNTHLRKSLKDTLVCTSCIIPSKKEHALFSISMQIIDNNIMFSLVISSANAFVCLFGSLVVCCLSGGYSAMDDGEKCFDDTCYIDTAQSKFLLFLLICSSSQ